MNDKTDQLKRRNEMKESKSQKSHTQQVTEYLIENKINRFIIKDLWKTFPHIKNNTMSTLVSRDLKKKGLVTKTDTRRGMSVVYQFHPPKPIQTQLEDSKLDDKNLQPDPESDSYDSYVKIGKGIEELLEVKNNSIQGLMSQLKSSKKMILDLEATVQDRDRHITEQGKKIHELSEKLRNKSGGSIKLDELQGIVNNQ